MPKYTRWSMRWPTPLHKIATEIAERNSRSLNEQVIFWLEHGGMPIDLKEKQANDLKIEYADLLISGRDSPEGIREILYTRAEKIRAEIEAMV